MVVVRLATTVSFFVLLSAAASAQTVRAVNAGGDLQAALDQAQPGDTILLEAGATFVGNFTLPNKAGTAHITIRSAAPDSSLPTASQRVTPDFAPHLPKIRSGNSMPAMTTAAGAHHWRLLFLEFQANDAGYGDIIRLGTTTATNVADQPTEIVIDRCYIHGDPLAGQKNGIAMHSRLTEIRNSYISDIKGVGQETHAIIGANGPGPFVVTNNYIEASGINFMMGGTDPRIVNNVPGMVVGATGYGITVTRNHIRKNPVWMTPFVPTPTAVTTAAVPAAGSLAAGTYAYRVAARMPSYQGSVARSDASAEVAAILSATGGVTVTWAAVPNATTYRVHGRTPGMPSLYFDVNSSTACSAGSCTFTDTGSAGTTGTVGSGTRWLVKNLFELKNGENVLLEGNLLEYNWYGAGDQPGYGVLLRSDPESDTGAPWTVVQRVVVRHNILRHSPGGVNVVGIDGGSNRQAIRANSISVSNNLLDDISPSAWGGGNARVFSMAGTVDVVVDHNTAVANGPGLLMAQSNGSVVANDGFVFTNNIAKRGTYGVKGDSEPEGTGTLSVYFPGAVFARNAIFGAPASSYPPDNFYPALSTWDSQFVSVAGGDYRLAASSPYNNAGTDGTDVGVDMDALAAAGAGATCVVVCQDPAVRITTSALPDGVPGVPYQAAVTAEGGAGGYAWQVTAGALPPGLVLETDGRITGVPMVEGTFTFTVRVQDTGGYSATAALAIAVASPLPQTLTLVLSTPDTHVVDLSIQNGSLSETTLDGPTIGTRAGTSRSNMRRALLKFDTENTLPAGAVVQSATLVLTVSGGNAGPRSIGARRVKYSFEESEATWLRRKIDYLWETPGGDLDTLSAQAPASGTRGQQVTFDVTTLVQDTVADRFGSSAYVRIALVDLGSSGSRTAIDYYSSEATDASVRPRLVVEYVVP